jgi:glycerol uptake facilitator-like aquaporin
MAASLALKVISEFFGTMLLMLSIIASGGNFMIIGLTLAVIIFLTGGISGAAVNPAVAAGLYYSGSLNGLMLSLYILAQVLGALTAVFAYNIVA